MELSTSGTIIGTGSFRCRGCGYVLTLTGSDQLSDCPDCGGRDFARASLFGADARTAGQETIRPGGMLAEPAPADREAQLARARTEVGQPGDYLCYEDGGELRTVALAREWTRIG